MATTQHQNGKTAGRGEPADALRPFADALLSAAEEASKADATVAAAFALGWQMAELYTPSDRRPGRSPDRLSGLGSISDRERTAILVKQIESGVAQLRGRFEQAGLPAPAADDLRSRQDRQTVAAFHMTLLGTLTAADYRLGKAYGLGRALADTCRSPRVIAELRAELEPHRVANLLGWLDDLSTALPPHAARSVARSLERWREHAAAIGDADAEETLLALRRQGELWRALLSGEKRGSEMLEIDNYVEAAHRLAHETGRVARNVLKRFPLLSALVVLLIVAGIVLLVVSDGAATIVAGASSLLAGAGLTWKGVGGAAGRLVGTLEEPLWAAELDVAIAGAITLLPDNAADHRKRRKLALSIARPDLQAGAGDRPAGG